MCRYFLSEETIGIIDGMGIAIGPCDSGKIIT
jgi:hypothetical protein